MPADRLGLTFAALADPTRRAILERAGAHRARPGPSDAPSRLSAQHSTTPSTGEGA